jgi:hypothetical protein
MNKKITEINSDSIQKSLEKKIINKISGIPVFIETNPYEYFGIYDSEGEIDFARIERIRETDYYKHYSSFRDHQKEKADKLEYFFDNYNFFTLIEDRNYVEQVIEI